MELKCFICRLMVLIRKCDLTSKKLLDVPKMSSLQFVDGMRPLIHVLIPTRFAGSGATSALKLL
jgi:hypothetical protein